MLFRSLRTYATNQANATTAQLRANSEAISAFGAGQKLSPTEQKTVFNALVATQTRSAIAAGMPEGEAIQAAFGGAARMMIQQTGQVPEAITTRIASRSRSDDPNALAEAAQMDADIRATAGWANHMDTGLSDRGKLVSEIARERAGGADPTPDDFRQVAAEIGKTDMVLLDKRTKEGQLAFGGNPLTDFTPIINIAATPNVIAAYPKLPFQDYKGMLAAVKREPGKYSYASPGNGSITHLMMEMFKLGTQTFMVHVPYRGSGPALTDAVAGQVPLIFDNLPSALPFIKEKRLTALVVAAPQRVPALPDVPTFKELGLESVNRMAYYGIIGPKGLPKDVVDRINAAVRKVVQDPAIRKRIEETGSIIMADTPEAFAKQMREELAVYKDVVAKQKLTLD